jgi:predicted Zn finger-like uncharacterized protein
MRFYGLPIGWIVGMIIQIPLSLVIESFDLTPLWWTVQFCGLLVMTIIAMVLEWKSTVTFLRKHKMFPKESIQKTKSRDGEKLTKWEKDFIWKNIEKDGHIICPNCESAYMVEGPSGGMSVNIRCPNCGQGINFLVLPSTYNSSALDWCDNIGIDEKWISPHTETTTIKKEPENTIPIKQNFNSIGDWFSSQYKGFINWLNT